MVDRDVEEALAGSRPKTDFRLNDFAEIVQRCVKEFLTHYTSIHPNPGLAPLINRCYLPAGRASTLIYCGDARGQCEYSRRQSPDEGLPLLVVDEEIYRQPPAMLIATVDKFAQMAWQGSVQTLFGR